MGIVDWGELRDGSFHATDPVRRQPSRVALVKERDNLGFQQVVECVWLDLVLVMLVLGVLAAANRPARMALAGLIPPTV